MKRLFKIISLTLSLLAAASSAQCVIIPQVISPEPLIKRYPDEDIMTLEADEVRFDELGDVAEAQGHAVARYQGMVVRADTVILHPKANIVKAHAVEGKTVTITQKTGEVITGSYLEYDLNEKNGFIDDPVGSGPVPSGRFFIKADQLQAATAEEAHKSKWIHGKYIRRAKVAPDSTIARWRNASYTTCPLDEPHYHMRSKRISMVPGRFIVLHRPRVYVGQNYLFTSPVNYLVEMNKHERVRITVYPDYDSDTGVALKAKVQALPWKNALITAGVGIWSEGMFEYDLRLDQKVADWLSIYAGDHHHYDDDLEDTKSRPFWGMIANYEGWKMELGWSEREKRSVVRKPGQKAYDTTIWRKPELEITTPWASLLIGDFAQYARLKGNIGSFQETGTNRKTYDGGFLTRYGWGIDYYTDHVFRFGEWSFSPFVKVDYWNYGYKNDVSDRQEITKSTFGYRAAVAGVEFGTAFEHKWVRGASGFGSGWDKSSDTDTLYQRLGFQLNHNWNVAVQAIFDLTKGDHEWTSLAYIITYDNKDCTKWVLTFYDDLSEHDPDDWVSLSFAITAFPDTNLKMGSETLTNPFGRPGGLKAPADGRQVTVMERDGTLAAEDDEISSMPNFDL